MTINDMLYDSITLQGNLIVTRFDEETERDVVLYDGDAACIEREANDTADDPWFDDEIKFIYPDMHEPDMLHIEL